MGWKPMQSVFISYASDQEAVDQQLEADLKTERVTIWRDKTNLHAGQRWLFETNIVLLNR